MTPYAGIILHPHSSFSPPVPIGLDPFSDAAKSYFSSRPFTPGDGDLDAPYKDDATTFLGGLLHRPFFCFAAFGTLINVSASGPGGGPEESPRFLSARSPGATFFFRRPVSLFFSLSDRAESFSSGAFVGAHDFKEDCRNPSTPVSPCRPLWVFGRLDTLEAFEKDAPRRGSVPLFFLCVFAAASWR